MKLSLLDLVQNILSSLDSDEVNSISDTVESRQVAHVVKTAYFNIITRANLPEHRQLFNLTSSGEADQPVLMYRPENVSTVEWLKYNIATDDDDDQNYDYVTIVPIDQFTQLTNGLDEDEDDVDTMVFGEFLFKFKNNCRPRYCTILNDTAVIFDAYDEQVDTTLQSSKTMAYGKIVPTFEMEDTFIPDLDDMQFPLLLNEAKSLAFVELKQVPHELAMREATRQWRTMQKNKHTNQPSHLNQLPNFGRK